MHSIYEINTWVWLNELSAQQQQPIDLASVPASVWDSIAENQFDAVWLMGVWQRSPAGIAIANQNRVLLADFRRALHDFTPADNIGSPYCVREYSVDPQLGGNAALAIARYELAQRGIRLILDYVPNHVAPDSPWIDQHPDYFFPGTEEDLAAHPSSFIRSGSHIFACGKDPNFPPWPDVVQLNVTHPGVRLAAVETLTAIAAQCDGVRCDMAVLMLSDVFPKTWSDRPLEESTTSFWTTIIDAVRTQHPQFLFLAEAYWGREPELLQQGFDLCYDKAAYDYLEAGDVASFRQHISAPPSYLSRLLRFLENHDEPRAAAVFPPSRLRACAVALSTLPGPVLFHEGQLEGRRIRIPVFLDRRPPESIDPELHAFYHQLLAAIAQPIFTHGEHQLCTTSGWPDNQSHTSLVAWTWQLEDTRRLIIVNLTDNAAQARIHLPWNDTNSSRWTLTDIISAATFERDAEELRTAGLYVALEAWQFHFFNVRTAPAPDPITGAS